MALPYTRTPWAESYAPAAVELETRLRREGHGAVLHGDPPRWHQARRTHPYPKTWWMLRGWLLARIHAGDGVQELTLRVGDGLDLQPGVPYELDVLGEGYATYLLVTPFALPPVPPRSGEAPVGSPWEEGAK